MNAKTRQMMLMPLAIGALFMISACGVDAGKESVIEEGQQALRGPIDPIDPIDPEPCLGFSCSTMCDMTVPSPGTPGMCCDGLLTSSCQSSGYYDGGRKDWDVDNDGVANTSDNCWLTPNANQANADGDLHGDACDNCPTVSNDHQYDNNNNDIGDACEDDDGDGIPNGDDTCPNHFDLSNQDTDADGVGDVCDGCPNAWNPSQTDSEPGGGQDACEPVTSLVWRGFEHKWGYNHRVRDFGSFVDSAAQSVTHIADAGTGKDNASWTANVDRVTTGYARFYEGSASFTISGSEGNTYGISRGIHLPGSAGHIDRSKNIVLLNGIEISESRSPASVMQFDKFDIELRDYFNRGFTVDLDYSLACHTAECGANDYEYVITVHYLVISGKDGLAMTNINTVSNAYNWDGVGGTEIQGSNERVNNVQHSGVSGTYNAGVVGLRGFSLDLGKEHHMLELSMRAVNPQYDSATNQLQTSVDAFFKNWRAGMSGAYSPWSVFSFGETGSAATSVKMSLIQFREATVEPFIARGGFDTASITSETVALNTLTPRCAGPLGFWAGATSPVPVFDGYNCFVEGFGPAMVPGGGYVWGGGWHYRVDTALSATCPLDGAQPWGVNSNECYAGHPPAGKSAFIFDDNFYFTP